MQPLTFDHAVLSSLPLLDRSDLQRVVSVLNEVIDRHVLPLFESRGIGPVQLTRLSERFRAARMEDVDGTLRFVSILTRDHDGWVVQLHERIFDFFAFGVPSSTEDATRPEVRRILALARLILRHEVDRMLFPERLDREVALSDARFIIRARTIDPEFSADLQAVLTDPTTGLDSSALLGIVQRLDADEPGEELAAQAVAAQAAAVADAPAPLLRRAVPGIGGDSRHDLADALLSNASEESLPVLRRARALDRLIQVLDGIRDEGPARLREAFDHLSERWGAEKVLRELEVTEPPESEDAMFAALVRRLTELQARQPGTAASPSTATMPDGKGGGVARGEPETLSLEDRVARAKSDSNVPRAVITAIEKNRQNLSGHSKAKYTEFIETLLAVPWGVIEPITVGPREFAAGLDASHYGLDRPKELVTDFFSNLIWRYRDFSPEKAEEWHRTGSSFLFVGAPGVGKTSLAISIATNLGIPYHKVSLGGMRDESDLRGHGFTYEGSKPGAIVQGLIKMGTMNGMFILDEADKTESFAIATLLEILDPAQNHLFHDRYTLSTVDIDLSNCHFVLTANTLETVPDPVIDRCQVVQMDRYGIDEKVSIALRHIVPRIRSQYEIPEEMIDFEPGHAEEHVRHLVQSYTHEAGVRQLALTIRNLFLRVQRRDLFDADADSVAITRSLIKRRLEEPLRPRSINDSDRVGEVLAVGVDPSRGVGGLIPIQATRIGGADGEAQSAVSMVHATGNIEKVMDESRKVATTGIMSCSEELGLDPSRVTRPVHLHFMGGSHRKDGPSAGTAIALALTSLLTDTPLRRDIAVTGEIDTHGRVTAVGGIDIKLETATEAGCKTFILPRENLTGPGGIERLPPALKRELLILDYEQWRTGETAFDAERHQIQVVGIDHVVQGAEIAFINERDLTAVEERFAEHGRRSSAARDGVRMRCPMALVMKAPGDFTTRDTDPVLCAHCPGCRLLIPRGEADRLAVGDCERIRRVEYEPGGNELRENLIATLGESGADEVAVAAPFFALAELLQDLHGIGARLVPLATNYTVQGVKIKTCKPRLASVWCRLLHLGADALDECFFVGRRNGIWVADLSAIPEKYRLDTTRAEKILDRCLERWLDGFSSARQPAAPAVR